jgi:multicomponent Na+:H+ antiporter subunit E
MPILLFLVWMIFNGRITVDVVVTGVIVVAAVTVFQSKFAGWSLQKDMLYVQRLGGIIGFLLQLIVEVLKANVHMILLVLSPKPEIQPKIVYQKTKVKTAMGKVALANSITLTPGTITVDVGGDWVRVHAIDLSSAEGLKNSWAEKKIEKMEEGL